jgi:hypothetical protein
MRGQVPHEHAAIATSAYPRAARRSVRPSPFKT